MINDIFSFPLNEKLSACCYSPSLNLKVVAENYLYQLLSGDVQDNNPID